jgi:hypothetical protein
VTFEAGGKRGSRCIRLGALLTSHIAAFARCCCLAEGFLLERADAPG